MVQARATAAEYRGAATAHKTALAVVLSEVATELNQAAAAAPVAGRRAVAAVPLTDAATMYGWIRDCIQARELGAKGLRESELKTVAGVPASMATPNQTTIPNAIGVLRANPQIWNQAQPPITRDELAAADRRMDRVEQAWNPTVEAARAERGEAEALALLNRHKAQLATAQQQLGEATAGTAAATHAQAHLKDVERQVKAAESLLAARARVAAQAAASAGVLLADPEKFARDHAAGTGLSSNDLRNMLLAGMRLRTQVTAAELTQMQGLEDGLKAAHDLRVTTAGSNNTLRTLSRFPNEDLYAWHRTGVNALDDGHGSVGQRINQIATAGDHMALTDPFLQQAMATARRRHAANEDEVVKAVARANNGDRAYAPAILACYNAKKAAAAAAAAKK